MGKKSKLSPEMDALATAQLLQFLAVGMVIAGVALVILGREHVFAAWLGYALGLTVAGAGGVLLWRASGRAAEAGLRVQEERKRKRAEDGAEETRG